MTARVLLSHPGCAPFVQNAARALHEAGLLTAYVTTFSYWPDRWSGRVLRNSFRLAYRDPEKELRRRLITEVPQELVINHPIPEFLRMGTSKLGLGEIAANFVWERTEKWFDRMVARRHLNGVDAAYGYEHACLETFRAQKRRGGICIYDMPTCHYSTKAKLVAEELQKFPQALTAIDTRIGRTAPGLNRRKAAELALADRVVVASRFVLSSLIQVGVPTERIVVVPSGAPPVQRDVHHPDPRKFVILAAGRHTILKGTPYLLEAWRGLLAPRDVELWLVGKWQLPNSLLRGLPGKVFVTGNVPREELFSLFDRANVLVFPTLSEGLALTPLEAMARGLPVITTPNSGADAFIQDRENGRLIPARDAAALADALKWSIEHPSELLEMGSRAAETMDKWQWHHYHVALGKVVSDFLQTEKENCGIEGATPDGQQCSALHCA